MLKFDACTIDNGGFLLHADLSIETGRIVAVIGPSGGGKTTLLEGVAGFLPLTSGEITWNATPLSGTEPGQRPVAMLFQDGNLFPHLTAAQNVGLGLDPRLRLSPEDKARIDAALTRVGLDGLGPRKPGALSGGQRARVALARLMVQDRRIFLLDEPFAALGPALKAEMLDLVAELARETGATVLMVSHEPDDARRVADEVILVTGGKAHPPAETDRLFADPPEALRAYLGDA
ncbi:MAG: ATP-binding cassette domain-containing protein [Roseovarius sp.]|uniref:thiamine ABC transporter ATP-binding protein n=1 Tax=Roseovarius sp. TaxID=1486281 RepID=UPI0032EF001F